MWPEFSLANSSPDSFVIAVPVWLYSKRISSSQYETHVAGKGKWKKRALWAFLVAGDTRDELGPAGDGNSRRRRGSLGAGGEGAVTEVVGRSGSRRRQGFWGQAGAQHRGDGSERGRRGRRAGRRSMYTISVFCLLRWVTSSSERLVSVTALTWGTKDKRESFRKGLTWCNTKKCNSYIRKEKTMSVSHKASAETCSFGEKCPFCDVTKWADICIRFVTAPLFEDALFCFVFVPFQTWKIQQNVGFSRRL